MNITLIGSIVGAFSDIPLGMKVLLIGLAVLLVTKGRGGGKNGSGSSNGGSSTPTPPVGGE